jgi:Ni/Co efflux regulator RcnB
MKTIITVAAGVALAFASLAATAQPGRYDHDRRGYDHHGRYDHRDYHRGPPGRYYGHRGPWVRGHRYDGPVYVVRDYGHYRLRPPPRGYHWVRNNGDYLLVAVATGVILDIATR